MSVAGRNYRLIVFFAKGNYLAVQLLESFIVRYLVFLNEKSVIGKRVYLKIIVKINDICKNNL